MTILQLKPLLLAFAFCVIGACQIVIGGGLIYMHLRYSTIIENAFYWPALILMLSGPVAFLLCWFGWNAAMKKNRTYLTLFSVGLIALLCVQFWICGWCVSMRESLPSAAEYTITNSFHDYFRNQSDTNHIWNKLQTDVKCCGIYGVMDYRHATSVNRGGNTAPAIPWACCSRSDDPHEPFCKHVFQRGCLQALSDDTRQSLLICALSAISCAVLQSIGLFCAIQMVILLGRTTSFDVERHDGSAPPQESLERRSSGSHKHKKDYQKELTPLASSTIKKKAPGLPVQLPTIPTGEKSYKERLHESNGN